MRLAGVLGRVMGTSTNAGQATQNRAVAPGAWPLVVVAVAQMMVVLDDTVVNVALPSAQAELGFAVNDRQWVVTAYAAAFAAALLLGGRLTDRRGPRRLLGVGAVIFAGASAAGAAAPGLGVLVAARALQGVGAGLLAPAALAALSLSYPSGTARRRAFAVFSATSACGAVVGLLLGGVVTEWSWRWSLLINAVIAVPVILGVGVVKRVPPGPARGAGIGDMLLALGGLLLLISGLSNAALHLAPLITVATGFVLLGVFVWRQHSRPAPLLPLGLLRGQAGAGLLALLTGYCGMFAVFLFLTFVMQTGLGFSPLLTGVAYLPMTVAIGAGAATAAALDRVGVRVLMPSGMILAAVAMVWLSFLQAGPSYWTGVLGSTVVLGAGLGLVFSSAVNVATRGAGAVTGIAAALVNVAQQTGIAVGTALLSGIAATAGASGSDPYAGIGVAFTAAAGIFVSGALAVAIMLRGSRRTDRTLTAIESTP